MSEKSKKQKVSIVEKMGFCNAGVRFSVLLIKVLRNLLKVIKIEPLL